ncbi:hypothetical protein PR202_ga21098 [Eleusine coracana subsp. coracana]|uniref:NAD-dependent epimerase/dehydratase domain-containing protein n=1 Tax=Eleusine coracana subsp. coracana TaxID=191504 RepID=A0AAV5CYT1_ELECO|nr:hypothetical protein PR202_ga21098 [Eleusine coracana subsp. coracana]
MVEPAVRGTEYVINAAAEAGTVRRVVFTSSIGAVTMDPSRGPDVVVDESCWSDLDYCKKTRNWYCYGKAVAEQAAWESARQRGVDLVVVNPVLVVGPLQATVNASIAHILKYLDGSARTCSDEVNPRKQPYKFTNQKLRDLGLEFRPVSQSLYDTVKNLQEKGHLPVLGEQTEPEKEAPATELQGGITTQA